jgi:Ca2+-binding RTX toxin-like protein
VISTENTTGDILTVIGNGSTIDLSGITVETADITTNIDATTWTGVSAVTITGTNDADDIDIDGGVGSTASGGAGDDNIAGGAGADTINGDGGADTITGGGGADTITGGGGGDTITSGDGADTIDLTEAVAATDTLITSGGAAGTAMSHDTVTGFAAGSASTADEVDIDISNIEALATNLSDLDDATSDTGAGNATASTVTEAFDAANLTSGTDLLIIGGGLTFSSVAAVADALEDGGSVEMTVNGADTAGDVYMVLYSDGTNSHLAAIETSVAAGDNGTYADGELSGNMVMTFNGISDATDFAATNFDFIA